MMLLVSTRVRQSSRPTSIDQSERASAEGVAFDDHEHVLPSLAVLEPGLIDPERSEVAQIEAEVEAVGRRLVAERALDRAWLEPLDLERRGPFRRLERTEMLRLLGRGTDRQDQF